MSFTKNALLAAGLVALAAPIAARTTDPASTKPAHPTTRQSAKHHSKHAATLKTGQLTTRQAARLKTRKASLQHQTHRDREQTRKVTSDEQNPAQDNPQNTNSSEIHLQKHNARMF